MFGKVEVYCGIKNEQFEHILAILREKNIDHRIKELTAHKVDIGREGACGRFGESQNPRAIMYQILIRKKDQDRL